MLYTKMMKRSIVVFLLTIVLIVVWSVQANAAAPAPFTITLESSFGTQSIAAGTKNVPMARYAFATDQPGSFRLSAVGLTFTGDTTGIGNCALRDGDKSLKEKKNILLSIPLPEHSPFVVTFANPLTVTADAPRTVVLTCDIASDAFENGVGKRYRWGIATDAVQSVEQREGDKRGEFVGPDILIAPPADHSRPGTNGETFVVVAPDIALDEASLGAIIIDGSDKVLSPGATLTATLQVTNKNKKDGPTWLPEDHVLVPTRSSSVLLWNKSPQFRLAAPVPPGGSVTLQFLCNHPGTPVFIV